MELHGVPNDIIMNLNPVTLIIFIPIMDQVVYPGIQRLGVQFTPLKRMYAGYMLAAIPMVSAAVIQHYIYQTGKCGKYPGEKSCKTPAPINVWVQAVPYVLIAFSEIFTSITGYEYAFTKAPKNMKSLGMFYSI